MAVERHALWLRPVMLGGRRHAHQVEALLIFVAIALRPWRGRPAHPLGLVLVVAGACRRVVRPLNPFIQIESPYLFDAKFFPRWEPRYLLYEGSLGANPQSRSPPRAEGLVTTLVLGEEAPRGPRAVNRGD